jgi:hypothetical protein
MCTVHTLRSIILSFVFRVEYNVFWIGTIQLEVYIILYMYVFF